MQVAYIIIVALIACILAIATLVFVFGYCFTYSNLELFATRKRGTVVYSQNILNDMGNSGWVAKAAPSAQINFRGVSTVDSWNTLTQLMNAGKTADLLNDPNGGTPPSSVLLVVDPKDADILKSRYKVISKSPKGYFVAITSTYNGYYMDCSFNVANKTIGYITQYDYTFIQAILHGYRIDQSTIQMQPVLVSDITNLTTVFKNDIDILFTFVIPGSQLHNVLTSQNIAFMGFKDLDVARVKLFYPTLLMTSVNMKSTFLKRDGTTAVVPAKEKETLLPTMSMSLLEIANTRTTPAAQVESFVTRLYLNPTSTDDSYRCYGDVTIENKALCDSPYDVTGEPKTRHTVWDRPCVQDTDCPYFKANQNYTNTRGKCLDRGVCELPVGVRRVSYRTYDDKDVFAPFCYGCNAYDTTCCDANRDFAFANDTKDRQKANLPTSINM
jgi:hypothetical protein